MTSRVIQISEPLLSSSAVSESSRISQDFPSSSFGNELGNPVTSVNDHRPRSYSFQAHNANTHIGYPSNTSTITPTSYIHLRGGIPSYHQNIHDILYPTYSSTHISSGVTDHHDPTSFFPSGSGWDDPSNNPSSFREDATCPDISLPQQTSIHPGSQQFIAVGVGHSSSTPSTSNLSQFPRLAVSPTLSAASDEHSSVSCGTFSPLPPTAVQAVVGAYNVHGHTSGQMDQGGPGPAYSPDTLPTEAVAHNSNAPPLDQEKSPLPNPSYTDTPSRLCAWGNSFCPCPTLVAGSTRSLRSHLKEAHGFCSKGRQSVPCQWNGCNRTLQRENMVRHILSHHMHLKVRCRSCGKYLCRRDVQTTHSKKTCPARK
ncbi:hypothetical protein V8B97DRAFT_704713 [Scleroderma yunnanense]